MFKKIYYLFVKEDNELYSIKDSKIKRSCSPSAADFLNDMKLAGYRMKPLDDNEWSYTLGKSEAYGKAKVWELSHLTLDKIYLVLWEVNCYLDS